MTMGDISNGGRNGPIFLTVHDNAGEDSGECNPQSVLVVEELWRRGYNAVVTKSLDEYKPSPNGVAVVSLFDLRFGLNRWSPCSKTASGVPSWARELSTGSCIAIGERCVAFPSIIEGSARQIARLFSSGGNSEVGSPWGPPPLPRPQQKRRRAWRAPQSQWRNLFWRGNGK